MKSGFLPKDKAPDDVIASSDRDATVLRGDSDPREGPPEDEPAASATRGPDPRAGPVAPASPAQGASVMVVAASPLRASTELKTPRALA